MAGILVLFSNEIITGVRGLFGPLLYMAELSKHHLIYMLDNMRNL